MDYSRKYVYRRPHVTYTMEGYVNKSYVQTKTKYKSSDNINKIIESPMELVWESFLVFGAAT